MSTGTKQSYATALNLGWVGHRGLVHEPGNVITIMLFGLNLMFPYAASTLVSLRALQTSKLMTATFGSKLMTATFGLLVAKLLSLTSITPQVITNCMHLQHCNDPANSLTLYEHSIVLGTDELRRQLSLGPTAEHSVMIDCVISNTTTSGIRITTPGSCLSNA